MMKIVWDEPKRKANRDKRGLDFADVGEIDWPNAVVEVAKSDSAGRQRMKAIGTFRDGTTAVIFALLGTEAISVISFRKANSKERSKLRWSGK